MKPIPFACALAGTVAMLSGCGSTSIVRTYTPGSEVPADAISYYLPKQFIAIEVERKKSEQAAPQSDKPAAGGKTRAAAATTSASGSGKPEEVTQPATQPSNDSSQVSDDGFIDTFTIRALPPVPDLAQKFYAHMSHRRYRDDAFKLTTTDSGLLTSGSATSTDQSGQVLTQLVSLVTEVKKLGTTGPRLARTEATPCGEVDDVTLVQRAAKRPFKTTIAIDPLKTGSMLEMERRLCSLNADYVFRFELVKAKKPEAQATSQASGTAAIQQPAILSDEGLFYRRAEPYVLSIYRKQTPAIATESMKPVAEFVNAVLISLPNGAPRERVTMPVDAAVTTKQDIKFVNGMLIEQDVNRPSSLVGGLNVPVNFLKAIVGIPSALFQFKVTSTNDETELVKAQTERVSADTAQIDALLKLQEAQEKQNQADGGDSSDDGSP